MSDVLRKKWRRKALLLYRLIQIICSIHNPFLIHRITVYMLPMHSTILEHRQTGLANRQSEDTFG